ncbi:MAG TPA: sugar porter family MFS transporter [Anaerohalosphaeraceae bacterium]|nr:sugar porter family MFS transporter [Anaerohalosphaeraceae bacterium]HQG06610.1 sugar porter family MFS transporter [Anaerohalosphaeraceae bacterium]HQI08121.1 sugar porter family MFS transporter [Anaerohalosphaeraceae bacterium]HQJ68465.1 sugar porter family MFS transporter [Anaerohalosphaeraceae bacterium]
MKIQGVLLRSAVVAALGGLLFGFDTAVISGAEKTLERNYQRQYESIARYFGRPELLNSRNEKDLPILQRTSFWHGTVVASALIGTVIGSLLFGKPADRYGRRFILKLLGILYFVSAVGSALAWEMFSFSIFRFIGGLAVGGTSVISPMYIAEISPARVRGRLVAITQFNIVLGILLAYLSNWIISMQNLGEWEWRWMFGVEAIPAALFFVLLFFTPRSPRWLVGQGLLEEARAVLSQVGTDTGNVEEELQLIQRSLREDTKSLQEPFFRRKYLKPIMLAVMIAMFNQLSGINALIYYTKRIFEMAGAESTSALAQSVIIGFTNLIFTMAAMLVIDHFGRKKLMLIGSIGYILSLSVVTWGFFSGTGGKMILIGFIGFIAAHAFGQGAVIWVFISEIFPNALRARGQALGSFTHWIMAALISLTFPMFAEQLGWRIFAIYGLCMVGQLLWVLLVMPETKGIPLEEIQKKLGIE